LAQTTLQAQATLSPQATRLAWATATLERMNILVTNDDGVDNPGIWALVRAVKQLGNVTVVAPASDQ
jgi:hypothetical protein